MTKMHWYKRDPFKALQGMQLLSLEERGAYNTIIDLIYHTNNELLDDDKFLMGNMRCDMRVWRRLKKRLIEAEKIYIEDGFIRNKKADIVLEEMTSTKKDTAQLRPSYGLATAQLAPSHPPKSGHVLKENKDIASRTRARKELDIEKKDVVDDDAQANACSFYERIQGLINSPTPLRLSRIQTWLQNGATELLIEEVIRTTMAKRQGDPPSSINYFEKAIAQAIHESKQPMRNENAPDPNNGTGSRKHAIGNREQASYRAAGSKTERAKAALLRDAVRGGYDESFNDEDPFGG